MPISKKHLNELQLDESLIYLNHAAVAPWPKRTTDAVTIDVQAINADFVMADGHKWMVGSEGLAVFYCKPDH